MPHNPIRVVVGPANYFSHPGSFNHLHDFFTDEQLSRAVWIYGKRAIAAAQTKLPPAFGLPGAKHILFRGHCSESDVQQLAAESGDDRSVVIGVGGGALLDTAKALARRVFIQKGVVEYRRLACGLGIALPLQQNLAMPRSNAMSPPSAGRK